MIDALILGRRGGIDPELQDQFAWSGLVHLLSISGFHVGLITAWVLLLGRVSGLSRSRAFTLAAAASVGYVAFLGWPAPATRAAALAVVIARCRVRQRHVQATPLLSATCLIVLLVDPWAILDLGGWLSAAALWGAATFSRWSDRALGRALRVAHVQLVGRRHAGHRADHGGRARHGGARRYRAELRGHSARRAGGARGDRQSRVRTISETASRERWRPGAGLTLHLLEVAAAAGAAVPGGHLLAGARRSFWRPFPGCWRFSPASG